MKKHFLLLLMAFMSLTGWAVDLVGSQFQIGNVTYSEAVNPVLVDDGTYVPADYTIDLTKWYTDEACTIQAKDGEGTPYTIDKLPVAKYWVKITGMGTYAGLEASASFNVIAIAATISFNAGQTKEWNTDEPANYTYTLTKKGAAWTDADAATKLGLTVGRVAGEAVAEYDYTFEWENKNYALTRADAYKFEITAKNIAATATITAVKTTMVYTGKNATGIYTVKDGETTLVEGTDWDMDAVKNVSAGNTPNINFKGNYTGVKAATTAFAITKAPITVSIDDIEVTYDGNDQRDQSASADLKFNYSGIVGDDVANAAFIKSKFTAPTSVAVATEAKNAGTYTLEITGGNTGTYDGANKNYEFKTWVPGTLTIKKAELKLKAADATKVLGAADPEFTLAAPAGLVVGHSVTGVTFTREAGEEAGDYAITPDISAANVIVTGSDPEVSVKDNYDLKVDDTKGVLSIGKGAIMVIIKDAEKEYGAADPTFTYKAVGLAEGDEITVTISREKAGTTEGEAVGSYALTATAENPDATKYSGVTIVDGVFTINKAKLTFVIPAQNIAQGKTAADLVPLKKNITVTGVNNSDDKASLYDLSFGAGVPLDGSDPAKTNDDKTVDDGLVATLTVAAQANYVVDDASDTYVSATTAAGKLIVGTGTATALPFTTAADDADYDLIKGHAGEVQDVTVTLNNRVGREVPVGTAHPWAAETWNTMVLPFEVTVAELSAQLTATPGKPGYAIVNVVDPSKTTEGNVQFKLEMQKIPANTPFCVKTSEAIPDATVLTFNDKLIVDGGKNPSVDASDATLGYKFVGNYANKTINNTTPSIYFLRGDTPKWARITKTGTTWTVVPFDAYIDQTGATASARELTFTFQELDGSYTAIKSIAADKNDEGAAKTGWYTIGGMKLQKAPAQKGVYIKDGKKVIIK